MTASNARQPPSQSLASGRYLSPARAHRRLGEILVASGDVRSDQVEAALEVADVEGDRIGEALVRAGACDEMAVVRALGEQFELPVVSQVEEARLQDELVERLPIGFARDNVVLPQRLDEAEGILYALCGDPLRLLDLDDLTQIYQAELSLTLAPSTLVQELINKIYSKRTRGVDLERREETMEEEDEDILHASAEDAPIIRFVNSLIFNASKEKASDIHIEPGEKEVVVRNRVDGILKGVARAPKAYLPSIVARVKIMAGLNIAEKRLPQDGRIRRRIAGREVDMRVATAPTSHGERVTIRLLDKSAVMLDLDSIGIAADHLRLIREVIHRPHGIFLVTGPTGSGKTTTLYSALSEINSPDLNILTVEDPVEFQLQGISQVQVQSKIALTFAAGLRSFLRHDPDVIMVGEIRDHETAEIAIQASLTGHLVLSTIHTNDAATGITRLVDMGVQPFLVASSLVALQAQRLVRRVCQQCCEPYRPGAAELTSIGIVPEAFFAGENCLNVPVRDADGKVIAPAPLKGRILPPRGFVWAAKGCERCNTTGYSGRTGIYEVLMMNENMRRLATRNASGAEIKEAAMADGMRTLRDDGAYKVLCGVTTIDEIIRVTAEET